MQDAFIGQKSGHQYKEPIPQESVPSQTKFFEIIPESPRHRQTAVANFATATEFGALTDQPATKRAPSASIGELLVNAETLLVHGEKDLARVLVYEALKLDSHNSIALKKAKVFLNPQKDLAQLIAIQKEICKSELSFENTSELAHLYYKNENDEQALRHYHDSLNLIIVEDASLFEVYKNMGNILTRLSDFEGAEEFFHKAFTINPDSDILAVNLGTLAIQRNDFHSALERFRSAVTRNAKNDKAWVGLALVHQEMGDVQLAFANIESAIDLNPHNRTAVHLFASWCIRESRYQNAIEVVQNFLSSVEVDEDLSLVLIHLFCKTNKFSLATLEAERVLLWNPQHQQLSEIHAELTRMKQGSFE